MTLRDTRTEIADVAGLTAPLGEPSERARTRARTDWPASTVEELDEYTGSSYAENICCIPGA